MSIQGPEEGHEKARAALCTERKMESLYWDSPQPTFYNCYMWFKDQQQQYDLGAYWKCRISGIIPDNQNLYLNKMAMWFVCTLKFEKPEPLRLDSFKLCWNKWTNSQQVLIGQEMYTESKLGQSGYLSLFIYLDRRKWGRGRREGNMWTSESKKAGLKKEKKKKWSRCSEKQTQALYSSSYFQFLPNSSQEVC